MRLVSAVSAVQARQQPPRQPEVSARDIARASTAKCAAVGLEPSCPALALPDRKDRRNLETQLRTTMNALAGTGESISASQIACDSPQPQTRGGDPDAGDGLEGVWKIGRCLSEGA